MAYKKEHDEVRGHPPRRAKCNKSPDGEHDNVETGRNCYDFLGTEVFVFHHCVYCGKKEITAEKIGMHEMGPVS